MTITRKAALVTALTALGTSLAAPAAYARPAARAAACPEVFGHGSYRSENLSDPHS
ncbi:MULTISPECIES: hypothetical protein [Nonomuraea]|uniref:Uncharacterized protein n=1 Tax=Nonomuraea salmonea TaxID=46181 RepID=A0ABV5P0H7_9ACTN